MKWVVVGSVVGVAACCVPSVAHAQEAALQGRVVALTGALDVETPEPHPAMEGETLSPGQRVHTQAGAHATLALPDDVLVDLGPESTVILFGPAGPPPRGAPRPTDTTLVRGSFHVHVEMASNAPPGGSSTHGTIATPGATLTLHGETDATVDIGPDHVARLSVRHGSVRLHGVGRDAAIHANHGARIDTTHAPVLPMDLPGAPTWTRRPEAALLLTAGARPLEGALAPPPFSTGPVSVTRWHLQVAHDPNFRDVVLDTVQPAHETRVATPPYGAGMYFLRVAAIDSEHFEGAFCAPVQTRIVSPAITPASPGHRASITVPDGFYCGLDGASLQPHGMVLPLAPGRPHTLHCSETPTGSEGVDVAIAAEQAGALSHDLHFNPEGFDVNGGTTVVVLALHDATGAPLSYANVMAELSPGALMEPMRESDQRGIYTSTLHWARGTHGIHLHLTVNNGEHFDASLGSP